MLNLALVGTLLLSGLPINNSEFSRLQQVLEQYGFEIKLELPPVRGAYGLLQHSSKTIWINPVVFDLGIAQPTLVHEAVHAAQSCAGGEELSLLGLKVTPPPQTRRYFLRYDSPNRYLEAEAYTVQVQSNGTDIAISLLHQHCRGHSRH